ncbi:MAG: hypothetical protein NT118_07275, partial [Lentisphaerae bacterium]|nr:hypothetical protein [Lentisphaerota bacterium]
LFKKHGDIDYREIKEADVNGKAWAFFTRKNKLPKNIGLFHSYIECVRWSADSKALLLVMWGHTDGDGYLDNWYCVYDLERSQPTLNFELMNRNTVHFKAHYADRRKTPNNGVDSDAAYPAAQVPP